MAMQTPLVTVVTITYNLIKAGRKETFLQCVESVKNQTYKNIEYIIIDGASDDGTLELIQSTACKYYSEPDSGIYYAMNKGIDKANGEYIAFLNSDDFWHDPTGVEESVKALVENNADFSYGTAVYLDKNDEYAKLLQPTIGSFYIKMPFSHQTMFTKTSYIRAIGKFDNTYNSAADYDLILRLILDGAKPVFVPKVFTTYRLGGLSDTQREQSIRECTLSFKKNYSKITSEKYDYVEIFNLKKFPIALYEEIYKKIHPTLTSDMRKTLEASKSEKGFYYIMQAPLIADPDKEQKTKIYLFNIPICRIAKTPTVKRINILGIPTYKRVKGSTYKRAYLFNYIQLYKSKKDDKNPNKKKIKILGFISFSLTKKEKTSAHKKYPKWLINLLCFFIPSSKNRKNLRDKHTKPSVRDLLKKLTIELAQNQENLKNEILKNQQSLKNELIQNQQKLKNETLQHQQGIINRVTLMLEGASFFCKSFENTTIPPQRHESNKEETCPICSSKAYKAYESKIMDKYTAEYFFCEKCAYLFISKPNWLEKAYENSITLEDTGILYRNNIISHKLARILFTYFNNGKYLDFAAGTGLMTRLMRDIGFDFSWYDKYTENFFAKGFEGDFSKKYEVVTAFEVFEHLENPLEEIENMLALTSTIIFSTRVLPDNIPKPTDWDYYGLSHGQHISFYSFTTLNTIANKYGLNYYNILDLHIITDKTIDPSKISDASFFTVKNVLQSKMLEDSLFMANKH